MGKGLILTKEKGVEIKGKVHCFFEQSGTFKNEFIKLGIPAEDYDIQDNFGQTDHKIDLFHEIEEAYRGGQSVFEKPIGKRQRSLQRRLVESCSRRRKVISLPISKMKSMSFWKRMEVISFLSLCAG